MPMEVPEIQCCGLLQEYMLPMAQGKHSVLGVVLAAADDEHHIDVRRGAESGSIACSRRRRTDHPSRTKFESLGRDVAEVCDEEAIVEEAERRDVNGLGDLSAADEADFDDWIGHGGT
jgi:hypothetical protein